MPYKNAKVPSRRYPGDGYFYVICDRCGLERRQKECQLTWDNLLVCTKGCWEPRHPGDILPTPRNAREPKIKRPEQTDKFLETSITTEDL